MVQDFLNQYWGIISAFIGGILYFVTHRQVAISYAGKIAKTVMLAAEKYAEQLVLRTGEDKFQWCVDKGYNYVPSWARPFVSKPLFEDILQKLFDQAVAFAKTHQIAQPSTPATPVQTPSEPAQPAQNG